MTFVIFFWIRRVSKFNKVRNPIFSKTKISAMRIILPFVILLSLIAFQGSSQQVKQLPLKSPALKMDLPLGSRPEVDRNIIQRNTSLLDSFIVQKDWILVKTNAEVFYTNMDSLKARLNKNKWTMNRLGGANSYTIGGTKYHSIKKDSFNYIAVITPIDQEIMVSMKPLIVSNSSQPYSQVNKIVASDRTYSTEFGRAVSITNNFAVVGVRSEDNDPDGKNPKPDAGAAYIYERGSDNKWKQVQKIVASDRQAGANFGWSVGISGNTIVAGAIYERFDATGRNEAIGEGAAYVFERGADGVWKQTQKLLSTDRAGNNYFGTAVGIDGNVIVVGAPGHSRDSAEIYDNIGTAGAVFVFERKGNNWRRTYKLLASDRKNGSSMGNSVAINGSLVIAGAPGQNFDANGENRMEASGAAYIWERADDGKWSKAKKLVTKDRTPYDEFGFSVAIDGDYAIVGAKGVTLKRTDENNDPNSGEAYIFSRNENGEWKEVTSIIPNDRKDRDLYGNSVGISGNYAIVGSPMGNTKNGDVGVIYIYWKNQQDKWVQTQKLSAADERVYSNFGGAVAIHRGFVITGAHIVSTDVGGKNEFSNAGAAYIFMRGAKETQPSTKPAVKTPPPVKTKTSQ